jgi:hypothetical protein
MPGGAPPRVLPLNDNVSLIVADVPASVYAGGAIEARLSDLDWVSRCGTAHHAVADEIVQMHTVIPFRLFTLFSSDAKAVATLGRRAKTMDKALERVAGKTEWVLKISKPAKGEVSPKLAEDSARAKADTSTGTSFLQKKAAAKHAAAEAAKRVLEDAARTYETLAAMASESTLRQVDSGAGLLLDASFLVPSRKVAAFKRTLSQAADGLLEAGCRVSFTGPWPPYSFVALEGGARG